MNNNIDQLKNENLLLKKEQEELYNQLKELNRKLEESDASKSHFLSNISNEIINPFTSIMGISQYILKLNSSDIEQIHEMASLINSEAFDLDFQLQNIFAAAKIESGENNVELIDLNIHDFVKEITDSFQQKAEKRNLRIELTHLFTKEHFVSDANKLRMILINLIINAITFSEENTAIAIHIELNETEFSFKISNQGNPISSENAKIIFDRFIKLDNSINSLNQGHGLGLSIIKDYVELLEGTVDFVSNEKTGTTFSVRLPYLKNKVQGLYMEDEDLFTTNDSEIF